MKKMIALLLSLFAVQTALAELPVVTEKLDLEGDIYDYIILVMHNINSRGIREFF